MSMHKRSFIHTGIALVAGMLQAASMAWPSVFKAGTLSVERSEPLWWLQILSLCILASVLNVNLQNKSQRTTRAVGWQSALLGWLFAVAWLTGAIGWTFVAMHTYGGLPFTLSALGALGLACVLALYYGAVVGLYAVFAPYTKAWASIVFAAFWVLAELARGTWLTGFGWGGSGYAHLSGPLAVYAPWLGVYGISALSAWVAMTIAQYVDSFRKDSPTQASEWRNRVGLLILVMLLLVFPLLDRLIFSEMSLPAGRLSVTLLQGNIAQNEKFEAGSGVPLALQWYAEQLNNSSTSLIIAPETAIPVLPQQLPNSYWETLQKRFNEGSQAALIGSPLGNYQTGYTNSVVGLKPGQQAPWQYDKHHLVPFGEFIPPLFKWFTEMMNIPLGDFNRGGAKQAPFEWQGQKIAATICYEDLFGEELARQFTQYTDAPTIFVNVSNLAWFGQSLAMDQHLSIARMRALEFERPFVVATNTGLTAVVDHKGKVVATMTRDTRGVLIADVEGRTGVTPYAQWVSRFGLWPLWLSALAIVLVAVSRRLRNR